MVFSNVKVTRHYRLHIPLHFDTTNISPVPLLLDYHGWSGTANSHENDGHDFFKVFWDQFFSWPKTTSSRWQMRTLRVVSSSLLDPGWVMEVQTISGEAGTVPRRMVHLVRSASFPGAKMRRSEKPTATTPVVPVTLTTLATGLPATTISCTPKL